jgi:hypothetical protein
MKSFFAFIIVLAALGLIAEIDWIEGPAAALAALASLLTIVYYVSKMRGNKA